MEKKETPLDEDSCLIRVKAQVMTREDGGWVPVEEGGYSVVGIYKMDGGNSLGNRIEYKIIGTFVATQKRVLECPLRTHDQYTATPNFHHWRTQDEKKYGLTFSNPADARAFSRGFRRAIEDMKEGCSSSDSSVNPDDDVDDTEVYPHDPLLPVTIHDYKNTHPCVLVPSTKDDTKVRDLIISNTCGRDRYPHPNNHQHLHKVIYLPELKQARSVDKKPKDRPSDEGVWIKSHLDWHSRKESHPELPKDSYVKLVKKPQSIHEYIYPYTPSDSYKGEDDLKKPQRGPKVISTQPPLSPPLKMPCKPDSVRCLHCGQKFDPENNMRGMCQDAPDETLRIIGKVTCICCAQALLYHCVNDQDEDYVDPCSCSCQDNHFCKRWTCLGMLFAAVPCLWCYVPLRGCHWCGKLCGCCGGRHKAT